VPCNPTRLEGLFPGKWLATWGNRAFLVSDLPLLYLYQKPGLWGGECLMIHNSPVSPRLNSGTGVETECCSIYCLSFAKDYPQQFFVFASKLLVSLFILVMI